MDDRRSARAVPPEAISSPNNPILKHVRSLQRRRTRHAERAFVVEGARAVADALEAGATPEFVLVRAGFAPGPPLDQLIGSGPPLVRWVEPRLFDELAATVSPQGVLAVFPFPDVPLPRLRSPLYLVLDRVADPGNLGTLLRSALGAGATAAFLTPGTVDAFNPKVVRAAMGAHFRLPILPLANDGWAEVREGCALRALADADGQVPYDALDWTQPAALIIGSEAEGPNADVRELASVTVSIPVGGRIESLNAAVAGAVILFEAARQRRRGPRRGARSAAGGPDGVS